MKYDECLQVLSPARLNKYAQASGNEKAKTLRLYQYNIKLSQRFYGVISIENKLVLTINRQPIGEWFKEQWEKLRHGLRQSAEEPRKSRGFRM